MIEDSSPFSLAHKRFITAGNVRVRIFKVKAPEVDKVIRATAAFFRVLDFFDPYQKEIGYDVWKLRCTLLYGLARFDHPALEMLRISDEVIRKCASLPACKEVIQQLRATLERLMLKPENPKIEKVIKILDNANEEIAIFAMMAMRKSFGSHLISEALDEAGLAKEVLTSIEEARSATSRSLIVPGTCKYLSPRAFSELFRLGRFSEIAVLLYADERFHEKARVALPACGTLSRNVGKRDYNVEEVASPTDETEGENEADQQISEALFEAGGVLHDSDGSGVRSRYVVADDGKGFFVPERENLRVLRKGSGLALAFARPVELVEGDFAILQRGDNEALLDADDDAGTFPADLDATHVWRLPLQALLQTMSPAEVGHLMVETGLISSAPGGQSITSWADGDTYGPGSPETMLALVKVLVGESRLETIQGAEESARLWFSDLTRIRSGRQQGGMRIRREIDALLEDAVSGLSDVADGTELKLPNGVRMDIRLIAIVGDRIRKVPQHALYKPV